MIGIRSLCPRGWGSARAARANMTATSPCRYISSGGKQRVEQRVTEHHSADGGIILESGPKSMERPGIKPTMLGHVERLVILPDRPNVLARRVEIRPRHSPNFLRLHNEGYVSWAGPLFDEHVDVEIARRPFKGSVMVVNEQSWRRFNRTIESDPYVKQRIWDLEKTSFIPFRTLMRVDVSEQVG